MEITEKRPKKKHGFLKFLGIYALVLLGIAALALVVFYLYIGTYERTRPATVMEAYTGSLTVDRLLELDGDFLAALDRNVQSEEEARACLEQVLEDLSFARRYAAAGAEAEAAYVYALESQGQIIGNVSLSETGGSQMGFSVLQVSRESVDLAPLCQETEFVLPEDYKVFCNGAQLPESSVVERGIPYALLEAFYDSGYPMPSLMRVKAGPYLGQPELEVFNSQGEKLSPEQLNEAFYTDNCTPEEKEAIEAFAQEYIHRYTLYLSGAILEAADGYMNLIGLVVPDSELQSRLQQAVGGLGFASSHGDTVQSVTLNGAMNVGGGCYVCDLTWEIETLGRAGYVTTINNGRLLLVRTEDRLRAAAQISY